MPARFRRCVPPLALATLLVVSIGGCPNPFGEPKLPGAELSGTELPRAQHAGGVEPHRYAPVPL